MDTSHRLVHPCRTLVYIFPRHKDRVVVSVSLKHSLVVGISLRSWAAPCVSPGLRLLAPSPGEASSSIMRGVFIAGIIAAFAITVVGERGHVAPLATQLSFLLWLNILALGVPWYLPPGLLCCVIPMCPLCLQKDHSVTGQGWIFLSGNGE